ncbi:MAG: hypothetical protein ACTS2F_01290 [Thainema sp.]
MDFMLVFWLICFVVLFGATEFYRWLIHLIGIDMTGFELAELPLPVFILAGVALAIASNYSKQNSLPFQDSTSASSSAPPTSEGSAKPTAPHPDSSTSESHSIAATSAPQIRIQSTTNQPPKNSPPISYTIDKENYRSERRPKSP